MTFWEYFQEYEMGFIAVMLALFVAIYKTSTDTKTNIILYAMLFVAMLFQVVGLSHRGIKLVETKLFDNNTTKQLESLRADITSLEDKRKIHDLNISNYIFELEEKVQKLTINLNQNDELDLNVTTHVDKLDAELKDNSKTIKVFKKIGL
ncbi:hypothetical protein N9X61_01220 [Sulfurimonas sp.]|nr:hypothetical protein [Sulfurimonas sp.]